MIRQIKKAFSLAEILIALAIISVIATMGFTITKKNIESAYDMYFYTGYTGMYNAIADANNHSDYTDFEKFVEHINNLFIVDKDIKPSEISATEYSITAPNNIKYTISRISETPYIFKIIMQVPSVKTKNNDPKEVIMYYVPETYDFLILVDDTDTTTVTGDYATKRIDLFPFYIDDGIAGKSIQHCEGNADDTPLTDCTLIDTPKYTKRNYYTFKAAFCKVYPGETLTLEDKTHFVCSPGNAEHGAIKLANPKKVF